MESDHLDSELDSFRRQWLSDLRSRTGHPSATHQASSSRDLTTRQHNHHTPIPRRPSTHGIDEDHDVAHLYGPSFDELPGPHQHSIAGHDAGSATQPANKALVSALDHFEEAMVKEAQGNMGDSLKLYRTAYKLDHGVDRRYREKHFPKGTKPPSSVSKPDPSKLLPQAQKHQPGDEQQQQQSQQDTEQPQLQSIPDLIASFSTLAIQPIPPEADGMPLPPCPIATLPDELLVHILVDVAHHDVADFARLSLVCRRFAYLAATEQRIWREVCLGDKFGFPGMFYEWALSVEWDALDEHAALQDIQNEDGTLISLRELEARQQAEKLLIARSLTPSVYKTWKAMFRYRPRIRFNGVYISTVNYVRTGQASTNQATWGGSPIHIVTYYRYLRFYRDGSVISLLSTSEPSEVVHHITKELLHLHREKSHASSLPSVVMLKALKGRWRLSSVLDYPDVEPAEQESDLFVETEGVGSKYIYRMDLSLRNAGKGAKNNKLVWRGFHSYNKLTDDLAEFGLKNDKPFFFSRVKSYGLK